MKTHGTFEDLVPAIPKKQDNNTLLIAISGFGGSGKSTLAQKLKEKLKEVEIISLDDFIIDRLSQRSDEWLGFDRIRYKKQILEPVTHQKPLVWDTYSWKENKISDRKHIEKLPKYLVVEGCSLLHPDLLTYYDFTVWIDMTLELATKRGAARDRSWGLDHDDLWNNLWQPNEADFFNKYHPEKIANFVYKAEV